MHAVPVAVLVGQGGDLPPSPMVEPGIPGLAPVAAVGFECAGEPRAPGLCPHPHTVQAQRPGPRPDFGHPDREAVARAGVHALSVLVRLGTPARRTARPPQGRGRRVIEP